MRAHNLQGLFGPEPEGLHLADQAVLRSELAQNLVWSWQGLQAAN